MSQLSAFSAVSSGCLVQRSLIQRLNSCTAQGACKGFKPFEGEKHGSECALDADNKPASYVRIARTALGAFHVVKHLH
jgi:hypothetical protein